MTVILAISQASIVRLSSRPSIREAKIQLLSMQIRMGWKLIGTERTRKEKSGVQGKVGKGMKVERVKGVMGIYGGN